MGGCQLAPHLLQTCMNATFQEAENIFFITIYVYILTTSIAPLASTLGVDNEVGLSLEIASRWHLFLLRATVHLFLLVLCNKEKKSNFLTSFCS